MFESNSWKTMTVFFCHSMIIMLRFGKTKVAVEEFYGAKKTIKKWDINVDNIVVSKLIKKKPNSKYLIEYLGEIIRPLVLILPKISNYTKSFKVQDGDKR